MHVYAFGRIKQYKNNYKLCVVHNRNITFSLPEGYVLREVLTNEKKHDGLTWLIKNFLFSFQP